MYFQINAFERLEITEIFVYIPERYDDFGGYRRGYVPFVSISLRFTFQYLLLISLTTELWVLATQIAL